MVCIWCSVLCVHAVHKAVLRATQLKDAYDLTTHEFSTHWRPQGSQLGMGIHDNPFRVARRPITLISPLPMARCTSYLLGWPGPSAQAEHPTTLSGQSCCTHCKQASQNSNSVSTAECIRTQEHQASPQVKILEERLSRPASAQGIARCY